MKRLLLALALALSTPAAAQTEIKCFAYDVVAKTLAERGYQRAGTGMLENGNRLEIWADQTGEFFALTILPDGATCPVGSGSSWRNDKETST